MPQDLVVQLMDAKLDEGRHYATLYVTAFSVYLTITGALLKVGVDARRAGDLSGATRFSLAGVAVSIIYLVACLFQRMIALDMAADVAFINGQLTHPLPSLQMRILEWISITSGLFTIAACGAWTYYLVFDWRQTPARSHEAKEQQSPGKEPRTAEATEEHSEVRGRPVVTDA